MTELPLDQWQSLLTDIAGITKECRRADARREVLKYAVALSREIANFQAEYPTAMPYFESQAQFHRAVERLCSLDSF